MTAKNQSAARSTRGALGSIGGRVGVREPLHRRRELEWVDRFHDVKLITGSERAAAIVTSGERSQRRRRRAASALLVERPHFANQLEAVLVWHPQIADDHMRRVLGVPLSRLLHGGGDQD